MKKNNGILFFIFSIFLWSFLIFKPALSQDSEAGLLPNAVQQFFDSNGNPLSSGKVYFYEVGTTTFKDTYTSSEATTTNPNPITLNAGGKAPNGGIYGIGLYRQLVKDRNGNTIWDAVTSPTGSGGVTPTEVGDGNLVGTVLPWSGLIAPNQYLFAYGQEIDRTTYPEFFTAITLQSNVICTSSSNTLTGISDTSQIPVGSPIELNLCVPAGSTVVSKTTSSVTLNNPSSVSINAVARFFPFGNGDGTDTFNVPDLRGYVLAGRNNMGGLASSRLTETYYLNNPNALGAIGGSQSHTQTISEMALHNHTVIDPGHNHGAPSNGNTYVTGFGGTIGLVGGGTANSTSFTTNEITKSNVTITDSGNSTPFTIVQPTITLNYIIKVTPDTSTSIATGVYSIGGMAGIISCGTGILCTGNIISFNGNVLAGGDTGSVQFRKSDGNFEGSPNLIFISPDTLTLGVSGMTFNLDLYGSTSGRLRQNASAIAGITNIIWGNSSGTPAVSATSPLSLNTTTGNISCPTCATGSLNGQALTKVDDTNITLTLGGSPTTALLSPTSLTLGWIGTLSAGRLNSNVVQSTTNDTNITGSISAQNLTLGWIGQLNLSRGGTGTSSLTANQLVIGGVSSLNTISCSTNTTVVHGGSPPSCSQIVAADITTNTITNSNLSQVTASTLKGNPTNSNANIQDFTFGSLTQTTSPSSLDWMLIYDNATNTFKKINANSIATSSVAGVSSIAGNTGAFTLSTGITNTVNNIQADIASTSNLFTGTAEKLLDANVVFTDETVISYGTTTNISGNTFINASITLTGNITTLNCSNFKKGQAGQIAFIQDSVGSRTAAFNTGSCSTLFKFNNATYPTLTTSASAIDFLNYSCRSSTYCQASLAKGYNP